MTGIMDFFAGVCDVLWSLVQTFLTYVQGLLNVYWFLLNLVGKIPDLLSWLPASCLSVVVVTFGIAIFMKIVGRDG